MKTKTKTPILDITIFTVVVALLAVFTGCKSIEVERNAQSLATVENADGTKTIVKDASGNPVILDGGWTVDYFQHWNWQKFDSLQAKAGNGVSLDINNYEGGAHATNLTQLVQTSLESLTKLTVAVGEAYTKISGGAQADTALDVAAKVANYFRKSGGDASKANVVTDTDGKTLTVSDGTTSVSCDANGNCSPL